VPLIESSYGAPWWLPGGHAQTIVSALLWPQPEVRYARERWDTPDGDFIEVDLAQPAPESRAAPLLVLFHGLEGSSRSAYARSIMRYFADRGWRAMVVHFRGCSGEANALPRSYHSGDSDEGDWILRRVRRDFPDAPLHAIGVSLGGNMLAKWLGERGEEASLLQAAASISAPLDLAAGGAALGRGVSLLYARHFLHTLRPKVLAKIDRFPGVADAAAVRACRDLYDFDNAYTAPVHGFRDTEDYWQRASAKPLLGGVRVPLLILNAINDPFMPADKLPGQHEVSRYVCIERPAGGGHVGFTQGAHASFGSYLPARLFAFLSGQ
jgi:predicted alpha/beta-fold hydrolase